ncbi:MAG: ATP-binding protein [Euryarchaeota archaeon]|nr:ATP-binding protein [Euryarchaeota archaeon]
MVNDPDQLKNISGCTDLKAELRSHILELENASEMVTKLETVINRSPAIVFFWKAQNGWPVEFVSENISQFGYSSDDLMSEKFDYEDMIYPDDREHVRSTFAEFLEKKNTQYDCEYRILTASNEIRWVYETTLVHSGKEGEQYHGIILNITERKFAEQAAMEKERDIAILYSASTLASESLEVDDLLDEVLMEVGDVLNISAGGIYLIDHDAREAVLRAYIGPPGRYVEKVHYSATEDMSRNMVGASTSPIVGEETDISDGKLVTRKNLVFNLYSKEQMMGYIQLTIPLDHEVGEKSLQVLEHVGKHIGIAIQNAQLFEKIQSAYDDLKSLDKLKSEFLANLSHELKTPLISIKGFSELLDEGRFGELNEQQKTANSAVVRNAQKLKNLIDSLLYMSMDKEGAYEYNFGPLDLKTILVDAVKQISMHVSVENIEFEQNIPDDLPVIHGDAERLESAFISILDNAIKFMSSPGTIKISVREEANDVHIRIKDNGIGIPQHELPKIFDMFRQVDGSTTRLYGGTGLGLHICKRIIDVHNGSIWIKSLEGFGTTAHIRLPK